MDLRTYYSAGGLKPSLADYPYAWYAKQFNENAAYCGYLYGRNHLGCIAFTAVGPNGESSHFDRSTVGPLTTDNKFT